MVAISCKKYKKTPTKHKKEQPRDYTLQDYILQYRQGKWMVRGTESSNLCGPFPAV